MANSSGSATPTSARAEVVDIYRPLASQVRAPLNALLPSSSRGPPPPLADLLDIPAAVHRDRLASKQLLLSTAGSTTPSASASALVKGKKRNRGSEDDRTRARQDAQSQREEREKLGLAGLRKSAKRSGGVIWAGTRLNYNAVLPLHHLHTLYLVSLLALPPQPSAPINSPKSTSLLPPGVSPESIQSKLVKADFTGASLSVISARNPSLVGIKGIVIEETASTFRLVSGDDIIRVIPKNGTLFEITFPAYAPHPPNLTKTKSSSPSSSPREEDDLDLELAYDCSLTSHSPGEMSHYLSHTPRISVPLLGTSFGFRSGDRAGRKFRPAQGGGGGSGWGEEWVDRGEWAEVLALLDPSPGARLEEGKGEEARAARAGAGAGAGGRSGKVVVALHGGKVKMRKKGEEQEEGSGGVGGFRARVEITITLKSSAV